MGADGESLPFVLETPEPNLVEGMKWFQNTVTRRFNTRHREWGRLFGDRYKSVLVDARTDAFYTTLRDYLHLNPCRAGLVDYAKGESLLDYPWSSLVGGFAQPLGKRPKWTGMGGGLWKIGLSGYGGRSAKDGRRFGCPGEGGRPGERDSSKGGRGGWTAQLVEEGMVLGAAGVCGKAARGGGGDASVKTIKGISAHSGDA